ncbi:MAG: YraN family protein [Gammaproteobacteria bacterium]|nr:MAG: YraN family protein [Gammaproteobacteria bacterium]
MVARDAVRLDGAAAEEVARAYLTRAGLKLLTRNHRCRGGEIDLVMEDDDSVVFVEVRYRSNTRFGRAEETVGPTKQARLLMAANHYLQRHAEQRPARFDVVAIHPDPTGGLEIEWIRDAFGT